MKTLITVLLLAVACTLPVFSQPGSGVGTEESEKIEQVIALAIRKLGGGKYKNATTVSSRGKLSILKDQKIDSFQSFVDIVVFPDKQRTDFDQRGAKTVQANTGNKGWIYDELFELFGPQTEIQLENYERGLRTHYDFLLRDFWKGSGELSWVGRRSSGIGRSNNVLKVEFENGFWAEYEFADSGFPTKVVYPTKNKEGVEILEENRYAQYILTDGIFHPYIVDHFIDGKRSYRVNYIEVRFNKRVPESIFKKPENPKKIKKLKI